MTTEEKNEENNLGKNYDSPMFLLLEKKNKKRKKNLFYCLMLCTTVPQKSNYSK